MTDAWNGVPLNPERDGWHWLQRKSHGMPEAWLWSDDGCGEGQFCWLEEGSGGDPDSMARYFSYLGPCPTPTEHAAAIRNAEVKGMERAATIILDWSTPNGTIDASECDDRDLAMVAEIQVVASEIRGGTGDE